MLCESCQQREATIHLTQVAEGSVKKVHLCEECAAKSGLDMQGPLSITDLLLGLAQKSAPGETPTEAERACPLCHMTRSDFKKTGRLGCARCYDTFAGELLPLINAMHRCEQHVGKIPARECSRVRASAELTQLQQELDKALAAENYEEAARLRDRMHACRRQLQEPEAAP